LHNSSSQIPNSAKDEGACPAATKERQWKACGVERAWFYFSWFIYIFSGIEERESSSLSANLWLSLVNIQKQLLPVIDHI